VFPREGNGVRRLDRKKWREISFVHNFILGRIEFKAPRSHTESVPVENRRQIT